jgi:DNA-binding MarR family transcriptional regulator
MTKPSESANPSLLEDPGRFAFAGLDRVLHEKTRLGILTSLLGHPAGLAFNDLRELCKLTDGNLSRHLGTLEEAELIVIRKHKAGNRTQTVAQLTEKGKIRFLDYLSLLEEIVQGALSTAQTAPLPGAEYRPA